MSAEKRIEFLKYLETSGLFDSITRVISNLYDEFETPIDPLKYLKDHLGNATEANADDLRETNIKLRTEISQLEHRIATIKKTKNLP